MSESFPICAACGTQYNPVDGDTKPPDRCRICDDPRQFIPRVGQKWSTHAELRENNKNKYEEDAVDKRIVSITTEPKFAIGQRAILIQTPNGNVLWDLIALLDQETIEFIHSKGGLAAIVISHPHFYTTWPDWTNAFDCKVLVSDNDEQWLCRQERKGLDFIRGPPGIARTVIPGVTAVKCGGHFDGSLVLHWEKHLFISDTLFTVASAHSPHPRPPEHTTFSFMWSIPNMIPMDPDTIHQIWKAIRPYDFEATHGNITGSDVQDQQLKKRMLWSAKFQLKTMGIKQHSLLEESL